MFLVFSSYSLRILFVFSSYSLRILFVFSSYSLRVLLPVSHLTSGNIAGLPPRPYQVLTALAWPAFNRVADHLAPPGRSSTLAALNSPLRLTAETATTSGCARFQARLVLAAGRISCVHWPLVRVCNSQRQALPEPPGVQRISSCAPGLVVATVTFGFEGWAWQSQGESGISAECWYTSRSRASSNEVLRMRLFMFQ